MYRGQDLPENVEAIIRQAASYSSEANAAVGRLVADGVVEAAALPSGETVDELLQQYGQGVELATLPEVGNNDTQKLAQLVVHLSEQINRLQSELFDYRSRPEADEGEVLSDEELNRLERQYRRKIENQSISFLKRNYGRDAFMETPARARAVIAQLLVERAREENADPLSLWVGIASNNGAV